MAHIKINFVEVKATDNCLVHALIIAIARKDSNYDSYRRGWKIIPVVRDLLETTGIDLASGGGIQELAIFQQHFGEYKIVVYQGFRWNNTMFQGRVECVKRVNLIYDDIESHYQVISNLTGAMAKKYVCKACSKSCRIDVTHEGDQMCSD